MASTYSTNLKIELIGTGEQSGTWGTTTNTNLGSLIEEAIAGYVTQAVTDGAATVLTIPNGSSSNGRNYVIELTGALTAARTVEVPAVDKPYTFFNNTSGGYAVTVKVSGQTGVTIANGKKAIVYTNSTDVIEVANAPVTEAGTQTLTNKTLSSPTVTGVATFAAGTVSAPAITTTGDTNTGIFFPAADTIAFAEGGSEALRINSDSQIVTVAGTVSLPAITTTGDLNTGLFFPTADTIAFVEGGAEAMRIDSSGNVGIGTSSPSAKLQVQGTQASGTANVLYLDNSSTTGTTLASVSFSNAGSVKASIAACVAGDGYMTFNNNNNSEKMRIDASGNVGIGTSSPNYQLQLYKAGASANYLQVTSGATGAASGNGTLFGVDASGNGIVTVQGAVNYITSVAGSERMRIDSSGNVGIGTSSPTTKLDAFASSPTRGLVIANRASGSTGAQIHFGQSGVADWAIGQPAGVNAFAFWYGRNTASDGTEAARIDSSGNLLVACTGTNDTATTGLRYLAGSNGYLSHTLAASTNGTGASYYLYSTGAGSYRFYVGAGGTVFATSTTITAISDQRLKENIQDIDVGLDAILALKPRKFDWKAGKGKDKKGDRGWIAQEFEQVFPDMIDTWRDPAPDGEEPYKAVNADLIPVLVKAIQEQQAQIEELKARVAALEGK